MVNNINGYPGIAAAPPAEGVRPEAERPEAPAPPAKEERSRDVAGDGIASQEVDRAVGKLNDLFLIFDKSVNFTVDSSSGKVRVKIIDNNNQEVLREYPPERVVDILKRIRDEIGVLVDEKA